MAAVLWCSANSNNDDDNDNSENESIDSGNKAMTWFSSLKGMKFYIFC